MLGSCGREPAGEEPPTLNDTAEAAPVVAVSEPPLDRAGLILAAIRAASAFAAGEDDRALQRRLDGKRFELRIRFGCGAAGSDPQGLRFNEQDRSLRLQIAPDLSEDDPAVAGVGGDRFEAVEGFWLQRPWMLSAACPATPKPQAPAEAEVPADADQPPPAVGWRLGIAQFFAESDARTTRRNQRPYEATKILDEGQRPSPQGYDFILSGRLRALPDQRVIACRADRPARAPDCIVSVHIDGARMERPDNGDLLAEWSSG